MSDPKNRPTAPAVDIVRFLEFCGRPPTEVRQAWPDWARLSDADAQARVEAWANSVLRLQLASPAVQYEAVHPALTHWSGSIRRHSIEELVGALAVAYIAKVGLYRSMTPPFSTANDYMADFLARCGLSEEAPRISKLVNTAAFWWEIFEAGYPVPLKLSTIEPLVPQHANRLKLYYEEVVKAKGKVPTPKQVRTLLIKLGIYTDTDAGERSWEVCRKLNQVRSILKRRPDDWATQVKTVLDDIERLHRPRYKPRSRGKPTTPTWSPEWPTPYTLTLGEDGAHVEVQIDDTHLRDSVRAAVWRRAHQEGWAELVTKTGWIVPLCDFDSDLLNHEIGELEEFFSQLCGRLGAPEPKVLGWAA